MPGQVTGMYSLKRRVLKQWIYRNRHTQPGVAKALRLRVSVFKRKLKNREPFSEAQIRRLVYFMGARDAFRVIYFRSYGERERVRQEVFGSRRKDGKRNEYANEPEQPQ